MGCSASVQNKLGLTALHVSMELGFGKATQFLTKVSQEVGCFDTKNELGLRWNERLEIHKVEAS